VENNPNSKGIAVTQDEIIELAIQGHASTRDAIRWAINQERERMTVVAMDAAEKAVDVAIKLEREACAKVAEQVGQHKNHIGIAAAIRARGQA
jgi:hypothetical protein